MNSNILGLLKGIKISNISNRPRNKGLKETKEDIC